MGTKEGTNSQSKQNRIQPGHTYIGQLSEKQRKRSKNMIYKKKQSQRGNMLPSKTSHARPNNPVSSNY